MSNEQVESLLKAVREDEAMAVEFQNCLVIPEDLKGATPKEKEKHVLAAVVALGQAKGFDFNADEARRAYRSGMNLSEAELSDEELEQVAGGKMVTPAQEKADNILKGISSWVTAGISCALASADNNRASVKDCMDPMIGKYHEPN